jgi:serine/threonine-protein kinase
MIDLGERWQVVSMLGAGGMGSVYLARDSRLGELVALKMINQDLAADPVMIERFREEVRLSRSVSSPYVARTHDLGEHDGRFFLTMQYVEGETLSQRLKREGALPLADVVRIAHDVCAGLDAVHAAGIVHRDLKPGNVLLAKDGRAVLTDFGIARRTSIAESSDGSGTPTYAAPEQLAQRAVDARADIYALGALLFAAATGRKPFEGKRTGTETPPDARERAPQLPEAFAAVIKSAMAIDPQRRPPTASAVYEALAPLEKFGARAESRLFDFVRSIAGVARNVAIELVPDGVTEAVRDAVAHHIESRLGESGEVRRIADATAAEAVLEGSVVLRDGKYTLPLHLRSREGDVFWRAPEDASASLPTITDAVARAAAKALDASCITDARIVIASPEASDLFMQARVEYRQFYRPQLERALQMMERVDQLEPNNPTIVAWHAATLARIRFFDDMPEKASELARRAIDLGARDAVPYLALAESALQDMRVSETGRAFVTGLRIAPGVMDARVAFAHFLTELGAFEPATRLAESLRAADPHFPGIVDVPLRIAAIRGRFDEVRRLHEATTAPESGGSVRVHISALRYAIWSRDRAMFDDAAKRTNPTHFDPTTRHLFESFKAAALEGRTPQPIVDAVAAKLGPRRRALVYQFMCELSAYLREDRRFFDSLDRVVATGLFDAPWIDACPLFDPYRGSLHFETARRTIHHRAYDALVEMDRCLGEPS